MFDALFKCHTLACSFDKTATTGTIMYQLFILGFTAIILLILSRFKKRIGWHYLVMVLGAFIFEFFTAPMWLNSHLGNWAYIYHGVSWVLTLGLSSMTLAAVVLVDLFLPKIKEVGRYLLSTLILWPIMIFFEQLVVMLGIRGYAPETNAAFESTIIPSLNMSWLAVLYLPLLFLLIISFYKYFSFYLDKKLVVPMNKRRLLRNLLISLIGVFLFELLIHPMVINTGFPSWSYVYRDITFILTGGWVLVIWLSIWLVDKYFIHKTLVEKFVLYLTAAGIIIAPVESWLIHNGYRVYQPSTVANFSGFIVPGLNIPVEVIFATPFYLALVIAFIKYWAIILDNKI